MKDVADAIIGVVLGARFGFTYLFSPLVICAMPLMESIEVDGESMSLLDRR